MWSKICYFILTKIMGWTAADGPVPEEKCIILGVPHTSMLDFLVSYLYYTGVGGHAKVMIKKDAFFWPLGPIMRSLGGVPVDRKKATGVVKSMVENFNNAEHFQLALSPEGTRKLIKKWKTGFHYMATQANIPVYLGFFDWGRKVVGRGEKYILTGDVDADLANIQKLYEGMKMTGRHPEQYCYNYNSDKNAPFEVPGREKGIIYERKNSK
ncbi:MAG: 1-acyl-sn-glycerol-3-phosphate acyltransferase [Bacteroidales bacterium]|nr:1-acyl-sn-glycerol-3-phosphate acyltransferase [Bacteroidales bacterium]